MRLLLHRLDAEIRVARGCFCSRAPAPCVVAFFSPFAPQIFSQVRIPTVILPSIGLG
jgi:hypothetical protein